MGNQFRLNVVIGGLMKIQHLVFLNQGYNNILCLWDFENHEYLLVKCPDLCIMFQVV